MRKRLKLAILVPMLLIVLSGLGYAIWVDAVTIHSTLISGYAPTISVNKGFINLQHSLVTINVRSSDSIIVSTSPDAVRVFVNITNTGTTPINVVRLDDSLPFDWYWDPEVVQVQLIQQDETIIEIGKPYFTASYDPGTRTLTVIVHDIKSATGKYLGMGEKIRIMFKMEYELKGQPLPSGYKDNPPIYVNVATAMAWIEGWSSGSVMTSEAFATEIKWVG